MDFDRFAVAVLVRPPKAPKLDPSEADRLQDAHMAHLAALYTGGKLLAAGPFLVDPATPERGLSFFACDVQEAHALCEEDPLVKAGQIEYHFFPWMTPAGGVSFSRVRYPASMAET